MRFDWLSFVLGFFLATLILIVLQGFLARLRWRTLNTALGHYARNLEHPTERGK